MSLLFSPLRCFLHFMFALAFFLAACIPPALAEEVEWSGDGSQLRDVHITNTATAPALAPSADSPHNNLVRVRNATKIAGYVFGGRNHATGGSTAASSSNSVSVDAAVEITRGLHGGHAISDSGSATADNNTVSATDATIKGGVNGGYAWSVNKGVSTSRASGNEVSLSNVEVTGEVNGGYARGRGVACQASNNIVSITGGSVSGDVKGGNGDIDLHAATGQTNSVITVERNTVSLESVTVSRAIGGYARNYRGLATTADNAIVLGRNATASIIYGGHTESYNNLPTALRNKVTINGGVVKSAVGGLATSTNDGARVEKNSVTINDGAAGKFVKNRDTGKDEPSGYVIGGYASKNGGNPSIACDADMIAEGNHVYINGGTVKANVFGSYASNYYNTKTSGGIASATNSSVIISGGEVLGAVVGGLARCIILDGGDDVPTGIATATNNTVTITGKPEFSSESTWLYGGRGQGTEGSDFYTGNTLNVLNYSGTTKVAGIANFQHYNFLVPSSLPSGSAYLKTGEWDMGAAPELGTVGVTPGKALPDGYTVDLISSEKSITSDNTPITSGKGINRGCTVKQGITIEYDGEVTTTETALKLTLTNGRAAAGTEAIGGGAVGSLIIGVQGSHVLATRGIGAARAATKNTDGFSTFITVEAENSRYHTGSHVDVKGVSTLAGVAGKTRIGNGLLIIGPAIEAAYADIEGHIASARGNGHARSFGGALLSHYQHDSGFYLDASLRAGRTVTNYDSGRLLSGGSATYRLRSPYYGLHVTPGWLWQITEQAALDFSASYFWTHVEGDKKTLSTGDMVRFEDADSHRLRGGARFSYETAQGFAPYAGAAYEYELDGDMRADSSGLPFKTLSLQGGYGVGELGLYWNSGPFFVDAGVQGYTGVREGFGGNLTLRYEF